jgi:hypothetical protein
LRQEMPSDWATAFQQYSAPSLVRMAVQAALSFACRAEAFSHARVGARHRLVLLLAFALR